MLQAEFKPSLPITNHQCIRAHHYTTQLNPCKQTNKPTKTTFVFNYRSLQV